MQKQKNNKPYGLWESPISAGLLGASTRLSDVQWAGDGTLVWAESESGVTRLYRQMESQAPQQITFDENVRGTVGYGGGEFSVAHNFAIFCDKNGVLYRKDFKNGLPRAITPGFGHTASPAISSDGEWVVFVYSDGSTDLLGIVDSDGRQWPQKLARGADFYMQPCWQPGGEHVAWIEWDHPNMPWEGTRLVLGRIGGLESRQPSLIEKRIIAGDEGTAVAEPAFSPDGSQLAFVIEDGEWESLVVYDIKTGDMTTVVSEDGLVITKPAWAQGNHAIAWYPNGEDLCYIAMTDGNCTLWQVNVATGKRQQIEASPYSYLHQLTVSPDTAEMVFIASSPHIPDRIVGVQGNQQRTTRRSSPEIIPANYYSTPKSLTWQGDDGLTINALYYPPNNPDFACDGLPPAIVQIHGGPTSQQYNRFPEMASYFTSRGYAWVELNYRGSTGFGRSYRRALLGRWGAVDVEDVLGCVKALVNQKLADEKKLVIMGGSAGGYTVLNTLARHPGVFAAGVCKYGVSDLFTLVQDTHKFELHYTDTLVGTLPQDAEKYRAWSPLYHADGIKDPIAVFQGDEDKVVPPSQSDAIVHALRANHVPHIYKVYEGEGHGFRKAETIEDYLATVEAFLMKHVLFI
ncbi:MAG TPA: S9 family peptidase [Chloroflexi bacterium]|nr:S9 family peptidase [Chloroflexota bacterium]